MYSPYSRKGHSKGTNVPAFEDILYLFLQIPTDFSHCMYNKKSQKRLLLEDGYECWFGYEVIKDGKLICCDEVEGYTLGCSEGFLVVRNKRKCGKETLEVAYFNDISDLKESLESDLITLREMFAG
mgnify:CR=1 FL=1